MAIQGTQTYGDTNLADANSAHDVWWNFANVFVKGDGGAVTVPVDSYITDINVYCRSSNASGGVGGSGLAQVALYSGTTRVTNTGDLTLDGTLGWHGQNYGNGPFQGITAGSPIIAGIWSKSSLGLLVRGFNNADGYHFDTASTGWPNPFAGTSKTGWGALGWFVHYFPFAQITGLTTTPVAPGQQFTITGRSFTAGVTSLSINGVAITSYTVNSDTQITATLPVGASSGTVSIGTQAGSAVSSAALIVSSAYVIRSGSASEAQGVFLTRSGAQSQAQGVLRYLNGAWVNAQ